MQSLCCLSGVQRSLAIALSQRLPGGLAQDVGVSCQQHQRVRSAPQREHCASRENEPGRPDRRAGCEDRPSCAALDKEQHLAQIVNGLLERGGIAILDCGFDRLIQVDASSRSSSWILSSKQAGALDHLAALVLGRAPIVLGHSGILRRRMQR
jgi:hypothetical protein